VTSIAPSGRKTGHLHHNEHQWKRSQNTGMVSVTLKISGYLFPVFCGNSSDKHNNKTGFKHLVSCHLKMTETSFFGVHVCATFCFINVCKTASKS